MFYWCSSVGRSGTPRGLLNKIFRLEGKMTQEEIKRREEIRKIERQLVSIKCVKRMVEYVVFFIFIVCIFIVFLDSYSFENKMIEERLRNEGKPFSAE